jgi:hypothetical protein
LIASSGLQDPPHTAAPLGATAEVMNLKMEPVADRGEQFAPIARQDTAMIGASRRAIAMGPPEAEDFGDF